MVKIDRPYSVIHMDNTCLSIGSIGTAIINKSLFSKWYKIMSERDYRSRQIEILNAQLCWYCCIRYNYFERLPY